MIMEIGRVCTKIAGRDAKNKCVIVDVIDDNYVLIDGQVRRKRCNIKHLEPLAQSIDLKKGASHQDVVNAFKKMGLRVLDSKPKEPKEKPIKQRTDKSKKKSDTSK
jgi:large subunit ribosomal protein L14e